MITAKEAVKKSVEYLFEVVGEIEKPSNVALEGIRRTNNNEWEVKLSYERGGDDQPSSLEVLLGKSTRKYTEIHLDDKGNGISLETAKVVS